MAALSAILAISVGAACGAVFRWRLGELLNPIFPTIPFGTLAANIIGGFLIGTFIALTHDRRLLPEVLKLAITTGFLGGLTTFSTFSAETVMLFAGQEYLYGMLMVGLHVGGSLLATVLGSMFIKLFI